MPIPAGKHTVEFKFAPEEYEIGNTVTLICSILLLGLVCGGIFYGLRTAAPKEQITKEAVKK
jgi:uncharacterized membrane protein YfhO